MAPVKHAPPPPYGNSRPSNHLYPENENLIQFYINREYKDVWIYIPESVRRSAICNDLVEKEDKGLYWRAEAVHVTVLERIAVMEQNNGIYIIL